MPVAGPARCTSTTTMGVSVILASPMASTISDRPGPEVAVMARTPEKEAPTAILIAAISSSACITTPPTLGNSLARNSMMVVAGVMG